MPSTKEVQKQAYTLVLEGVINKLKTLLQDQPIDEVKVTTAVEQLTLKFSKIEKITDELQNEMEAEKIGESIEEMDDLERRVIEIRVKAKSALEKPKKLEDREMTHGQQQPVPVIIQQQAPVSAKLPDATLQEFSGDEEKFPSFIDNFTALVDSNPHLSDIEKFGYLRGVVKVDVINHYPMTAANYKSALEKLKRVYGDKDLIATKHLNALLDMSKRKKPSNNIELQDFHNFLETKLTCLEALNKPVDQKNQMLITLIYRQLPKKIKSKIAQLDATHSTVSAVMNIISKHIKTAKQMDYREASDSESDGDIYSDISSKIKSKKTHISTFKPEADSEDDDNPISSAAALPVLAYRNKQCIFCNSNHSPVYCQNVSDINQRRDIVQQSHKCFNCLGGHRVSNCRSQVRCRFCQGKHHSSLCLRSQQSNSAPQQRFNRFNGNQPIEHRNIAPQQSSGSSGGQHINSSTTTASYAGLNTASSWEPTGSVLLQMAEAEIRNPMGQKYLKANIFFDPGSQYSYCTKEVKDDLQLQPIYTDVLEINTFGGTESKVSHSDIVTLQIVKGEFVKEVTVHTTQSICNPLPSFKISKRKLQELGGITLASPRCKYDGVHEISLLIGADLYWQFIENESISTSWGSRAVNSKLGWLLSGPVSNSTRINATMNIVNAKVLKSLHLDEFAVDGKWINQKLPLTKEYQYLDKFETVSDKPVTPQVKKVVAANLVTTVPSQATIKDTYKTNEIIQEDIEEVDDWFKYKTQNSMDVDRDVDLSWFWEIEHIGIIPEEKEQSVWQQFIQEIKYLEKQKRYEVGFPCKMKMLEDLPDNYHLCEIRLKSLLNKLNKTGNEELLRSYDGIIKNYLEDKIIEEVDSDDISDNAVHHLSHHCVIRKDKTSTAVRMVFDGSAKANKKSISLNQCLHTGPSLVNNLAAVLLRFRLFKIALVSDISKAFLQLSLKQSDRDITRFLWRENGDINNPIKVFRFVRVPFGLSSSPFLLHATIIHHLGQYITKYPDTVPKLLQSFYVDDLLTGEDEEEKAVVTVNESNSIMKEANMELKKWVTNSPNVLRKSILSEDSKLRHENSSIKVLGLTWNTNLDKFEYNVQQIIDLAKRLKPSKRTVLKIIQKVYDPLGALSPYMITAKVLLQRLCKLSLSWDQLLPEDLMEEWIRWIADLQKLQNFKLPRCIKQNPQSSLELVGFCDASKIAYAAVVYLRCSSAEGIKTNLVIAKSRVSPMKPLTIPRLELLGGVLLARLMSVVLEILAGCKFHGITYYTDSMNVLYWIKDIQGTKKWNRYISNRLDEINTLSSKQQWQHCKGVDNPADYPTRGMTMDQLSSCNQWLHGPEWLSEEKPSHKQNTQIPVPSEECLDEELKIVHSHAVIQTKMVGANNVLKLDDYGQLRKLYRVTSYLCMFMKKHIEKKEVSHLEMMRYAELKWIISEQTKYYSDTKTYLNGEGTKPNFSIARQLDLFIDKDGVIRCSGRYKYANLSYKVKYPILMPKESHLTRLIIQDRHRRVKHAGVKTTLTQIREEFWIPQGRKLVKSIVNQCVICRRLNAKSFKVPGPPPLPAIRYY